MRYLGGKYRTSKSIIEYILSNSTSNTFIDLFTGGCNIISRVPTTYNRIANNNNYDIYVSEYEAPSDFECVWEKSIMNNFKKAYNNEKLFKII